MQVQNKLQLATPLLPQIVQQQGVSVSKANPGFLMVLGFVSEDGSMDQRDIADYLIANLTDPISRVAGVGSVQVFGARYAMRIWLDPDKLTTYKLTTADVIAAMRAQNQQVAVGQLGGTPAVPGQRLNATITVAGPAADAGGVPRHRPAQPVRTARILQARRRRARRAGRGELQHHRPLQRPAGHRRRDLARDRRQRARDRAAAGDADQGPAAVLPAGVEGGDPVRHHAVRASVSIKEVVKTLLEAVVLVFLVMYLFLQNFRATLIPTIAVPVVLLGTFGVLAALGFSINMLTMFAMVLAIGLLVDDAIVVVENVERLMSEEGLTPLEATRKSMDQITGALIGIGLVLSAVFVPMAFLGGSTGVIYRQFSATIVSAMALSVLVAIVLTPALCATMLKQIEKGHHASDRGFFGWFNRAFDRGNRTLPGRRRRHPVAREALPAGLRRSWRR